MSLRDKLETDIKTAMRSRDQQRLDTLRFLKNAIQLAEKDRGKALDDAGLVDIAAKQVRDRRESLQMFKDGNRVDLAAKEEAALAALQEFLPQQMSRAELTALAKDVLAQVGATGIRDKGKVMGRLMPLTRGKADGAEVNAVVTELLEQAS